MDLTVVISHPLGCRLPRCSTSEQLAAIDRSIHRDVLVTPSKNNLGHQKTLRQFRKSDARTTHDFYLHKIETS